MKRFVFLALVLASCCASAQVTKCTLPNGKVTYGDGPCPAGAADSRVNTTANVLDASTERNTAARMRDDDQRRDQPAPGATIIGGSGGRTAGGPGAAVDEAKCRAAQRDLDLATSKVKLEVARGNHPGPASAPVRSAELKVDAACGTNIAATRARAVADRTPSPPHPTPNTQPPEAPRIITDCRGGACYDNQGGINWQQGNSPYFTDPSGRVCQKIGDRLQCP